MEHTEEYKSDRLVELGHVAGVLGVKGWLRVHSYTEPRDNIFHYTTWELVRKDRSAQSYSVEEVGKQGKALHVKLSGVEDRDQAAELLNCVIAVDRHQLPPAEVGVYYWTDLEGLTVVNTAGALLGTVERLIPTGAHDVLVVKGDEQHLIPFVMEQVVKSVELEQQRIVVAWESDY
jgi:16S rRNA processing protein RimM